MLDLSAETESAQALALHLLEPGAAPVAGGQARAVAWALKDLCQQAWSTEPPRVVRAADALRGLLAAGVPPEQAGEIRALAEWTTGIAHITQGQMVQAVRSLDLACASFRAAGLPDPAAQTQVAKIVALSMLGRHEQAIECAEATQAELLTLGNLPAARV